MNVSVLLNEQIKKLIDSEFKNFKKYTIVLSENSSTETVEKIKACLKKIKKEVNIIANEEKTLTILNLYSSSFKKNYFELLNIIKQNFDNNSTHTLNLLSDLDELYNNVRLDLHAIQNVIFEPKTHSFLTKRIKNIIFIFKKNHNKDISKELSNYLKTENYNALAKYLDNGFGDLDLKTLIQNEDDIYYILNALENVLSYWNIFLILSKTYSDDESNIQYSKKDEDYLLNEDYWIEDNEDDLEKEVPFVQDDYSEESS